VKFLGRAVKSGFARGPATPTGTTAGKVRVRMQRYWSDSVFAAFRNHQRPLLFATIALALTACTPTLNVRGYVPDEEALATIEPKRTTREQVESTLGSPSTESTFNDKVWYYINERTERVAFFDPTLIERKVIAVVFDDRNVVEDVVTYTAADGQDVQIVSRTTPTAGNEVTLLQQLFGNIGRFSKKQ
jgi:outer membrane protein assembly factor BamE (lipoprotein component of BamABCDE complex)